MKRMKHKTDKAICTTIPIPYLIFCSIFQIIEVPLLSLSSTYEVKLILETIRLKNLVLEIDKSFC